MKRIVAVLAIALVVGAVLLWQALDQQSGETELILAVPDDSSLTGEPRELPVDGFLPAPAVPSQTRMARMTRLADGDSFDIEWLDTGDTDEIRLVGLNAPEKSACFGDAAQGVLQTLIEGQTLIVETVERDEFGRVLANVWVDDVLVNLRMVEIGAALALSGDGAFSELLDQGQQLANESQTGLWDPTFCGVTEQALRIGDIQADAPGQDNLNPNGEWIEILNVGDEAASLQGWSLRDESTRHRYSFPDDFVLDAQSSVQVFSGCGDDTADELYWCDGDPVWNNGGDTAFLVDPDGRFADSVSYSG